MRIRSLEEGEKEQWLDFVAKVFTNTPRAYFQRHMENDSDPRMFSHIFVALAEEEADGTSLSIAGTLRLFPRAMYHQGRMIDMVGVGEVSVDPLHRRQGIASQLLTHALSYMRSHASEFHLSGCESDMLLSSLHTGEAAPLYRSVGFQSVALARSVVHVPFPDRAPIDIQSRTPLWEDEEEMKVSERRTGIPEQFDHLTPEREK